MKTSIIYKIMGLLVLTAVSSSIYAQNSPQYTQYMYNTMSINPGYAGSLGTLDIVGTYRDQWIGIEGAPVTQNLGIHAPLRNDKIGLGLNIENDNLGPANQFFADGNFSYTLQLSPTIKVALGVKAGIKLFNVDFTKGNFQNPNDPLAQNIDNRITPTLGAGAFFYTDNWYVGLSVPDFTTDNFYDDVEQAIAQEEIQYFLMGGYVIDMNPSLKFKPAFLLKYLDGFPVVVDVSANFLFNERFTIGAAYRYEDAISGLAGIMVFDGFFAGYSYDYTLTDFSNYNSGTHEIVLRYTLPKKSKRVNSPRFF